LDLAIPSGLGLEVKVAERPGCWQAGEARSSSERAFLGAGHLAAERPRRGGGVAKLLRAGVLDLRSECLGGGGQGAGS